MNIYNSILNAYLNNQKLLAILLDPDKILIKDLPQIIRRIQNTNANYIFIGGSTVGIGVTDTLVSAIKKLTNLPLILFPGDYQQISLKADALLFLNLISGNNPEYLIHQQIKSVPTLLNSNLEIIPTGYLLIDGGTITSTIKVTNTQPINPTNVTQIIHTALAGQYMGQQLIYLEAGSGAKDKIQPNTIKKVSETIKVPLIVGGGIKSEAAIHEAFRNGATLVVIGNAFEKKIIFTKN